MWGLLLLLHFPLSGESVMLKSYRYAFSGLGTLLLVGFFFIAAVGNVSAAEAKATLNVRSAILLDAHTGKVLYEQNADTRIPPASLTKVLSMMIALDKIKAGKASLSDKVAISRRAASQAGSKMHIRRGEKLTLNRLLTGMAVSSGNDASMAVAEHIGGSEKNFVRLMNAKAKQLGMRNSSFKNPNGLPAPGQVTTARDMARLSYYYLRFHPDALRYHKQQTLRHNGRLTTNKNPLLGSCPGADGLKTGWITASGYNIISTVRRGNARLIAVVLGAQNSKIRGMEISRILEAGFDARNRGISVASALNSGKSYPVYAQASDSVGEKKLISKKSKRSKLKPGRQSRSQKALSAKESRRKKEAAQRQARKKTGTTQASRSARQG